MMTCQSLKGKFLIRVNLKMCNLSLMSSGEGRLGRGGGVCDLMMMYSTFEVMDCLEYSNFQVVIDADETQLCVGS